MLGFCFLKQPLPQQGHPSSFMFYIKFANSEFLFSLKIYFYCKIKFSAYFAIFFNRIKW